jgi:ectoine hydroxylase-related dioxygenase (phytanoyl-CoA dioxygenase family)
MTTSKQSIVAEGLRDISAAEMERHRLALDQAGYSVIKRFMNAELVSSLKDRVTQLHDRGNAKRPDHPADDHGTTARNSKVDLIVWNLQNTDKTFIDLVSCPQLASILIPILNDPFFTAIPPVDPNYILAYCNARSSVIELPLHTDVYLPVEGRRTWGMQTIFALDDQVAENGCMVCVPGSHLRGEYVDCTFGAAKPVETESGDVVIFSSRLWHGALPNRTGSTRWAVLASFRMWWAKQLVDIPRGLPDPIYQQLTNSQKALLGYCAIPPLNERERISTKTGYDALRPHVRDYFPPVT